MEIVIDPVTGLVSELFNGTVMLCSVDVDCPEPGMVCAANRTWAAVNGMCVCSPNKAWRGSRCDALSAASVLYATDFTICAVIALVAFFRSCILLMAHRSLCKLNSMALTLVMCAIGSLSLALGIVCIAWTYWTPCVFTVAKSGERLDCDFMLQAPLLGCAFFFISMTALNISVNWIEAAIQSDTSAGGSTHGLTPRTLYRYKVILSGFYFLYSVVIVCVAFLPGGINNTATAILPPLCVCILSYAIGWSRIRKLLHHAQMQQGMVPGADRRMEILRTITSTFFLLSVMILGTMASAIVYVAVGGQSGATPLWQPNVIASLMLYNFSVGIPHVVINYLRRYARSKTAAARFVPRKKSGVISGAVGDSDGPDSEGAAVHKSRREFVMSIFRSTRSSRALHTVMEESVGSNAEQSRPSDLSLHASIISGSGHGSWKGHPVGMVEVQPLSGS